MQWLSSGSGNWPVFLQVVRDEAGGKSRSSSAQVATSKLAVPGQAGGRAAQVALDVATGTACCAPPMSASFIWQECDKVARPSVKWRSSWSRLSLVL